VAGQFLSIPQLKDYIDSESVLMVPKDMYYDDYFEIDYYRLIVDILSGVILADNVQKYQDVLVMYLEVKTTGIDKSLTSYQEDKGKLAVRVSRLLVLESDGGWNILTYEVSKGTIGEGIVFDADKAGQLTSAIQSTDIAHYMLVERLSAVSSVNQVRSEIVREMLLANPQHIGFFLKRFPKEVTSEIQKLASGKDLSLLRGSSYNKYTRRFFRTYYLM
jgi:hypothetical protein